MYKHRLVSIGDSLTQGFKSGAIFEPQLSYPAIIAREMGLGDGAFRYAPFNGQGGLPINLEYLLRKLDHEYGRDINFFEVPLAAISLRGWLDDIEDYWERGPGAGPLGYSGPHHNLAVWGFQAQDAYQVTAEMCKDELGRETDNWLNQIPENAMLRTALRVLNPSHDPHHDKATQVSRAAELAADGGIENLIVFLGANNILGTVTALNVVESTDADLEEKNPTKRKANFYQPRHFKKLLAQLMRKIEKIGADERLGKVFWGNVPSVTIPPVTHGVGGRLDDAPDDGPSPFGKKDDPRWYRRYFRYYTRPWIPERNFNPMDDPCLTGEEMIEIDRAVAEYAGILEEGVRKHNEKRVQEGAEPNWFVVDLRWALERLAFRRYREDPSVPPPPDWSPYELPDAYAGLNLDTRFLRARDGERVAGGLFSLDGIHATTVGYGLIAQEFIDVMQANGVKFYWGNGTTPRVGHVKVNYRRLITLDTLMKPLPQTLDDVWEKLVDGDQLVDVFKRALRMFGV